MHGIQLTKKKDVSTSSQAPNCLAQKNLVQ